MCENAVSGLHNSNQARILSGLSEINKTASKFPAAGELGPVRFYVLKRK